jgi:hypothetical protein
MPAPVVRVLVQPPIAPRQSSVLLNRPQSSHVHASGSAVLQTMQTTCFRAWSLVQPGVQHETRSDMGGGEAWREDVGWRRRGGVGTREAVAEDVVVAKRRAGAKERCEGGVGERGGGSRDRSRGTTTRTGAREGRWQSCSSRRVVSWNSSSRAMRLSRSSVVKGTMAMSSGALRR